MYFAFLQKQFCNNIPQTWANTHLVSRAEANPSVWTKLFIEYVYVKQIQ